MLRRFIQNLAGEKRAVSPDAVSWRAVSQRSANVFSPEQLSGVFACIDVISSAVASLPVRVKTRKGEDTDHPLNSVFEDGPNDWQSWHDFIQWYMGQALLHGNALAEIKESGEAGYELWPVPWDLVSVYQLPSGRLRYDFARMPWGNVYPVNNDGRGTEVARLLPEEVIHLRDRTDDGLVGRSRLSRVSNVVSHGHDLSTAISSVWKNGLFPSGAISFPGFLDPASRDNAKADLQDSASGASNLGKVMILEGGGEFSPISVDPQHAEILESRRFTVEEACRIFGVPPPLAQEYSNNTFTNAETAGRWFSQFTLAGWVRKLESAMRRSLLAGTDYVVDFDMSAFERGDPMTRWSVNKIAIETGVFTPEEVRAREGLV